jgi:hypothetical protein
VRSIKQRHEKFKNEQVSIYEKEISEKNSEIHILKDMVKANQLQLKAKDKDLARYKQKYS